MSDLQKQINELETQKRALQDQERQRLRREAQQRKAELKAAGSPEPFISDDYAGFDAGPLKFYYGYEVTQCPVHMTKLGCEKADCEKAEWCFVCTLEGKEIAKHPSSMLNADRWNVVECLLSGIGRMIHDGLLQPNPGGNP